MLRRRKNKPDAVPSDRSDDQTQPDTAERGQHDTYSDAAALLAGCPNPFAGLVVVIEHLRRNGAIGTDELAMIGIDAEEAQALEEAFDNNNSIDELAEDVVTAAHLRNYRKTLEALAKEAGIDGEDGRERLQRNLTGFALENDIEDLRLAYRLMRLERPDLLT